MATVRYVELNPVRAKLCSEAFGWPWSSARAHFEKRDDGLVLVEPMLERVNDWQSYLARTSDYDEVKSIRRATKTGRPIGGEPFFEKVQRLTGRDVRLKKVGRKSRVK